MFKTLITIVGPTGIGKTRLAIKIATHFNAEIISSDSRQFYKEMTIGTAVPSKEELAEVPHHFIQHQSIENNYSVGNFEREAIKKIVDLHQKNPVVIMVGGSGLYTKAVTHGLDEFPEVDIAIRKQLNMDFKSSGLGFLQKKLHQLDSKSYHTIAIDNPQRVIRALEVCIGTGRPYSSYLTQSQKKRPFRIVSVGLNGERSAIYNRINKRVDIMMTNGLLQEAKSLYHKRHLNALNTVGYKELFRYFDDDTSLNNAIEAIKTHTRRFAKRQLTWFNKDKTTHWFDYETDLEPIIKVI